MDKIRKHLGWLAVYLCCVALFFVMPKECRNPWGLLLFTGLASWFLWVCAMAKVETVAIVMGAIQLLSAWVILIFG